MFFLFYYFLCREDVSKYFPALSGRIKISLIEAGDKILPAFDERMGVYALSCLKERGVNVQVKSSVTKITSDYIELKKKGLPIIPVSTESWILLPNGQMGHKSDLIERTEKEKKLDNIEVSTVEHVQYGSLVWAGGIATRPITKAIATAIGIIHTLSC